jgi:hypothetical protein
MFEDSQSMVEIPIQIDRMPYSMFDVRGFEVPYGRSVQLSRCFTGSDQLVG